MKQLTKNSTFEVYTKRRMSHTFVKDNVFEFKKYTYNNDKDNGCKYKYESLISRASGRGHYMQGYVIAINHFCDEMYISKEDYLEITRMQALVEVS